MVSNLGKDFKWRYSNNSKLFHYKLNRSRMSELINCIIVIRYNCETIEKSDGLYNQLNGHFVWISSDLRKMCKLYGRTSQEVIEACKRIEKKILACSTSFKDVWHTYKLADPDSIEFIVFCEPGSNRSAELSIFVRAFDIEYRSIGKYNYLFFNERCPFVL